ncbi:MAG: sec-independent protein translocase TatC [Flavobacteriales bacterium]|nr:sec-independent protein translocase TatC [Flavobacteriales bacterium]
MDERHDIATRADIEQLMQDFYELLLKDEVVSFLFTDVAKLDLEEHLPRLSDFWEDQLLGTNNYNGNPMRVHMDLHRKSALKKEHFDTWLMHFNRTVDARFAGPKAHLAKERALSIATVMQIKVATASQR